MENKKNNYKGILISLLLLIQFYCALLLCLPNNFFGINTTYFHLRYDVFLSDVLLFSFPLLVLFLVILLTLSICYIIGALIIMLKYLASVLGDIIENIIENHKK